MNNDRFPLPPAHDRQRTASIAPIPKHFRHNKKKIHNSAKAGCSGANRLRDKADWPGTHHRHPRAHRASSCTRENLRSLRHACHRQMKQPTNHGENPNATRFCSRNHCRIHPSRRVYSTFFRPLDLLPVKRANAGGERSINQNQPQPRHVPSTLSIWVPQIGLHHQFKTAQNTVGEEPDTNYANTPFFEERRLPAKK